MSDAAIAAEMIREVSGAPEYGGRAKVYQERAFQLLHKINPSEWTRRRVRSLWEGTAARIELREALEMAEAIAERRRLADARKEHQQAVAFTNRLEALLAVTDPAFHGPQIEALRRATGRVDLPGTD